MVIQNHKTTILLIIFLYYNIIKYNVYTTFLIKDNLSQNKKGELLKSNFNGRPLDKKNKYAL